MDNTALYQEKFERIRKAICLEPVDRVPVIYMGNAFAPRFMGMSIAQFCSDLDAASQVQLQTLDRIGGFDGQQMANAGGGLILTTLWLSHVRLPGKELPDDALWQIAEAEVMTHADYDTIIEKGWPDFFMNYLPRVVDMAEFGAQMGWTAQNGARLKKMYDDAGYVTLVDAPLMVNIPYEYFCGGRSMQQFIFDLHRIPDKVEAAIQVVHQANLASIKSLPPCPENSIGGSWIGGWRTASALVSPKIFNRFIWPYIVETANAMIEKGYIPIFHWDQDWTRDVGRLVEFPAKKCILNPDGMTDTRKFKELVGDRMAMLGDVPASLLAAGNPEQVHQYVKDLVELFEGRGLLICPGCDAPINTKPENMIAMVEATYKYGTM